MGEMPRPNSETPYQRLVRGMRARGILNSENMGRVLRGEPVRQWDFEAGAPADLPSDKPIAASPRRGTRRS